MRIGIVGAGVAGLVTAKVLRQAGHDVVVFDKSPDIGGVWSATRRYPGLTTQSAKATYAFSDFPMPKSYPEWPSGDQIQQYLADYAQQKNLTEVLWLDTEVLSAVPDVAGWTLEVRDVRTDERALEAFDHLVVANGVFSQPMIPSYEGIADFEAAGGRVCAASDVHEVESLAGKNVLVIGYGKSACDVAVRISESAASTDVIARQMLWKVPKKIAGVVNFKFLLLTRMGEALFRWQDPRGMEKFLHGVGRPMRRQMLGSVQKLAVRQYKWRELGLLPAGDISDIVKNAIGLVTDGFYEAVAAGAITVRRDRTVKRLLEKDGAPHAELSDGTVLPADVLVAATGYRQELPFLSAKIQEDLKDERGNFMLYRQIHPLTVPDLSFAGYNSSFFSPLNAEVGAMWIAGKLGGLVDLPAPDAMHDQVVQRLAFLDEATGRHHSHGTKIIPFSMHIADEALNDLGLQIGRMRRAQQWLGPIDPRSYRKLTSKLVHRLGAPAPVVRAKPVKDAA